MIRDWEIAIEGWKKHFDPNGIFFIDEAEKFVENS